MAASETLPKKRTDLVEVDLKDEIVIYDQKTGDAHALNGPAAKVWRLLSPKSTLASVAARVAAKSDVDGRAAVRLALREFAALGLLADKVSTSVRGGVSRRQMLQQLAFASAAIPAVQSIKRPQGIAVAVSGMPCTDVPTQPGPQPPPFTGLCFGACPGNPCCFCSDTTEGSRVCIVPVCEEPLVPCTSSGQCPAGHVCVAGPNVTCCSGTTSFCIPLCTPTSISQFCSSADVAPARRRQTDGSNGWGREGK